MNWRLHCRLVVLFTEVRNRTKIKEFNYFDNFVVKSNLNINRYIYITYTRYVHVPIRRFDIATYIKYWSSHRLLLNGICWKWSYHACLRISDLLLGRGILPVVSHSVLKLWRSALHNISWSWFTSGAVISPAMGKENIDYSWFTKVSPCSLFHCNSHRF